MPDINVNKLSEILNTKADIDLNNTGVFSTSSGGVNLVQSTPSDAKGKEVASADFSLKQGGLELMDVVFAPLGIDETKNKRRYLNGQLIIQEQFPAFTAAVKARMTTMANAFTTETNWQAEKTNSKLGQCGKFVVDDTAGTIRLPCVVNAQGLVDLALIGGIKSESLPNFQANLGDVFPYTETSGAVTSTKKTVGWTITAGSNLVNGDTTVNPSVTSSTYQDNAPVQQEAVQYPYCIVVNTGVEEAERPINNYQVNNVYSYGMSQYYKGTMNNNSWLKSAGQWNDGTVYTGMYNWLLEQMNAGVSGFVASSATYTDYDFVVNQNDQTFRLPLLNGEEDLPSGDSLYVSENLKTTTRTTLFTAPRNVLSLVRVYNGSGYVNVYAGDRLVGTYNPNGNGQGTISFVALKGEEVSIEASTSGINYNYRYTSLSGNGTLYFYVGDTLQNAQLVNVARIEEKLVDKADSDLSNCTKPYVTETYRNGTEWYRVWSDGWIEQGGFSPNGSYIVNFLKPFTNANYIALCTFQDGYSSNSVSVNSRTNTSLILNRGTAAADIGNKAWRACGY